jgi:small subunit ribosomal protein S17
VTDTDNGVRAAAPSNESDERGTRRTIIGKVTSNKMAKTVVVEVIRRVRDRRFHKFVTRRVHYKAHDETNKCGVGDVIEIVEARRLSATKRWRLLRIVSKLDESQVSHSSQSKEV